MAVVKGVTAQKCYVCDTYSSGCTYEVLRTEPRRMKGGATAIANISKPICQGCREARAKRIAEKEAAAKAEAEAEAEAKAEAEAEAEAGAKDLAERRTAAAHLADHIGQMADDGRHDEIQYLVDEMEALGFSVNYDGDEPGLIQISEEIRLAASERVFLASKKESSFPSIDEWNKAMFIEMLSREFEAHCDVPTKIE